MQFANLFSCSEELFNTVDNVFYVRFLNIHKIVSFFPVACAFVTTTRKSSECVLRLPAVFSSKTLIFQVLHLGFDLFLLNFVYGFRQESNPIHLHTDIQFSQACFVGTSILSLLNGLGNLVKLFGRICWGLFLGRLLILLC